MAVQIHVAVFTFSWPQSSKPSFNPSKPFHNLVSLAGIEPACRWARVFETRVSAYSTTETW